MTPMCPMQNSRITELYALVIHNLCKSLDDRGKYTWTENWIHNGIIILIKLLLCHWNTPTVSCPTHRHNPSDSWETAHSHRQSDTPGTLLTPLLQNHELQGPRWERSLHWRSCWDETLLQNSRWLGCRSLMRTRQTAVDRTLQMNSWQTSWQCPDWSVPYRSVCWFSPPPWPQSTGSHTVTQILHLLKINKLHNDDS